MMVDGPALDDDDEVEITSEMLEAGADVVLCVLGDRDCLPGFFSAEGLATRVYRAMHRMRD